MAGILLEDTGSDEQKGALARKLAAEESKIAMLKMERARGLNGEAKMRAATSIPGEIVRDTTVPAGANNYVSEIPRGRRLRIIDIGGQQAVDFLAFDLANTEIRYNNANSIKLSPPMGWLSNLPASRAVKLKLPPVGTTAVACRTPVRKRLFNVAQHVDLSDNFFLIHVKTSRRTPNSSKTGINPVSAIPALSLGPIVE